MIVPLLIKKHLTKFFIGHRHHFLAAPSGLSDHTHALQQAQHQAGCYFAMAADYGIQFD